MRTFNKICKLLYIIALPFLVNACGEEEIDLKLKSSQTRLVVDGLITTDTTAHCVRLTLSGDYFHNKPLPTVSGAIVTLSDGHETIVLSESADKPGCYLTPDDYYGKQQHWYKLEITGINMAGIKNSDVFTAESYLNPMVPVDSIAIDYHKIWKLWKVLLYCQDPGDFVNYYLFRVYRNQKLVTDNYSEMSVVEDRFFDGNYAEGVWIASLNAEKVDEDLQPGDVIMVESLMIDRAFYDFVYAAQIETRPKDPIFSGPPANVPGNISNGAMGIFAACSVYRNTIVNKHTKEEMAKRK